jgi:hypothetical protein
MPLQNTLMKLQDVVRNNSPFRHLGPMACVQVPSTIARGCVAKLVKHSTSQLAAGFKAPAHLDFFNVMIWINPIMR